MKRHLIVIDPQRDFCKPDGALYVPGADDDMKRLAAYIARDGSQFDAIHVTLDSHQWVHIAHPAFWVDANDLHPAPFTTISSEDIQREAWLARDPEKREAAAEYVRQLAVGGRYQLTIWPPHCIIGMPGHAVHDELSSALRAWSEANLRPIDFLFKGSNLMTEHYSAIRADVLDPLDPSTAVNQRFIGRISEAEELVFAGEALDYCVLNTLRDLFEAAPDLAARSIILRDASSSISGCTVDDHEFFAGLGAKGVRFETTS